MNTSCINTSMKTVGIIYNESVDPVSCLLFCRSIFLTLRTLVHWNLVSCCRELAPLPGCHSQWPTPMMLWLDCKCLFFLWLFTCPSAPYLSTPICGFVVLKPHVGEAKESWVKAELSYTLLQYVLKYHKILPFTMFTQLMLCQS